METTFRNKRFSVAKIPVPYSRGHGFGEPPSCRRNVRDQSTLVFVLQLLYEWPLEGTYYSEKIRWIADFFHLYLEFLLFCYSYSVILSRNDSINRRA